MSKRCFYCGLNGKRTKEHLFGKWSELLHANKSRRTTHVTDWWQAGTPPTTRSKRREGAPHAQSLRVPCESCNNGWMSRRQSAAKEVLTRLAKGDWSEISAEDQANLAAWASMFSMTFENADLRTACSTEQERAHLMQKGSPPPGWWVAIGLLPQEPVFHAIRRHYAPNDNGNFHVTTFAFGRMAAHVLCNGPVGYTPSWEVYFDQLGLQVIWPNTDRVLVTPQEPLTEAQYVLVCDKLFDAICALTLR